MKSPAVKKTPTAVKKTPVTPKVTRSKGPAVATPPVGIISGRNGKTPTPKNGKQSTQVKGKQTPVGKGKKQTPKKKLEEVEEEVDDEEVESGDENDDMELDGGGDESGNEEEDSDDDEGEEEAEDESSEGEEVPLPEGSVSGDSPDEDYEPPTKTPANKKGKPPSHGETDLDSKRTVFVGNLPSSISKKPLIKWFSKFGKVESVRFRSAPVADLKIPKKIAVITKLYHENASNINAYVKFTDESSARNALKANGEKFDDTHHIRVDLVGEPKELDSKKALFIGNLPFTAKEDEVRELFADCGDIESIRIVRDKLTKVGKGFGYVNFVERNSVQLALQKGELQLDGRTLKIQKSERPDKQPDNKKGDNGEQPNGIYVANMPYAFMTEDNLKQLFSDCGTITNLRIPKNKNQVRGFAVINFSEPSAVEKALKKSGEKIEDRALIVRHAGGGPRVVSIDRIAPEDNSIFGAVQCLGDLLSGVNDVSNVSIHKRGTEFVATVTFEQSESAKAVLNKNGTKVGNGHVTITLVESKSFQKHQQMQGQKRKFDFKGNNQKFGFNKRPKFERGNNQSQNGDRSFHGVETNKQASADKKIAMKNKKKQKTQRKREELKQILNKDD